MTRPAALLVRGVVLAVGGFLAAIVAYTEPVFGGFFGSVVFVGGLIAVPVGVVTGLIAFLSEPEETE